MKKGGTVGVPASLHLTCATMTYCQSRTIVKMEPQRRTAVSLRCRSWGCPDCVDTRKAQLVAEAHGGAPNTFLTLTSRRRDDITANDAAKKLAWCWRLIRLRLMRHYNLKKLPFIAVVEATKLGWPHLHILLRAPFLDRGIISDAMAELDDSPIVDIRRIDDRGRVSAYVAKYATKCDHKFGTTKRYWKSRDYELRDVSEFKKKKGVPTGWLINSEAMWHWILRHSEEGWIVKRESKFRATAVLAGGP